MRQLILFTLILLLGIATGAFSTPLLKVHLPDRSAYNKFIINGFDITGIDGDYAEVVGWQEDIRQLDALGLEYSLIHADLEAFYRSRLDYELDDMGGYPTFSEIGEWALEFVANYPDIVSGPDTIGYSLEDRPIWTIKISDNPGDDEDEPELFLNSAIHAREVITPLIMMRFAELLAENYGEDGQITHIVDNREIWILPVVNPDGYTYNEQTDPNGGGMWRKNKRRINNVLRGVDLNRNFSYEWGYDDQGSSPNPSSQTYRGTAAHSEPETEAIEDFVNERNFIACINYHSYSNLIIYPYGYDDNAYPDYYGTYEAITEELNETLNWETGRAPDVLYPVNGDATDWMEGGADNRLFAFVFEVGTRNDGFWPPTNRIDNLVEQQEEPLLTLCELIDDPFQFSRPESFDLLSPADGDSIRSLEQTLVWEETTDPDPDLTPCYDVWLGTLADLSDAELIADSIEADSLVLSNLENDLEDDEQYYWTVRATDDDTQGKWANDTLSFNLYILQPPAGFTLAEPEDEAVVNQDTVAIRWNPSSDPDPGDNIEYIVEWSQASAFPDAETFSIATEDTFYIITGLEEGLACRDGVAGQLDELPDNDTLFWRVKAEDRFDLYTWGDADSTGRSFYVYVYDTPYPFSLISPGEGDTCRSPDTTLTWNMSRDPDPYDNPAYDVWLDTLEDLSTAWLVGDSISGIRYDITDLLPNHTWYWTVRATDSNTPGTWADDTLTFVTLQETRLTHVSSKGLPEEFSIAAAYPNPFNPSINIVIGMPQSGRLLLSIFNILGRETAVLVDDDISQGYNTFIFNTEGLPSGIYFIKASITGKGFKLRKITLIK